MYKHDRSAKRALPRPHVPPILRGNPRGGYTAPRLSNVADPLPGIDRAERQLGCYSELHTARACVLVPATVDDLRRIFAYARQADRRVTLRSGGHSFDDQALGDDLVVSMTKFDSIDVDAANNRVRVGPGASWGAILAKLQPRGLVPPVTVTTEHATAGGTLCGDCLSRFSPTYGKVGAWVDSFDLLTIDGTLLTCRKPEDPAEEPSSLEERVFLAAIGGFGYLGAVVAITYRVLPVGQTEGRIGVRTIVRKYHSVQNLAQDLVPDVAGAIDAEPDPADPTKLDAIWSALYTRVGGGQSALLFTSDFTTAKQRRRMSLHRPRLWIRVPVEWIARVPFLHSVLFRWGCRLLFVDREEYIDDLEGYTFFMDGNVRAKEVARRLGFTLRTVQQTFVVPSDPTTRGWESVKNDLVQWLDDTQTFFRERELKPTLYDVVFIPKDHPFLLSSHATEAGFAVSYAFETSRRRTIARAQTAFTDLADVLWQKFGGRVYLVKNVYARRGTLAEMYGENAAKFFRLKRELDPECVLCNAFLERTFGDLLRAEYGSLARCQR